MRSLVGIFCNKKAYEKLEKNIKDCMPDIKQISEGEHYYFEWNWRGWNFANDNIQAIMECLENLDDKKDELYGYVNIGEDYDDCGGIVKFGNSDKYALYPDVKITDYFGREMSDGIYI